MGIQVISGGSVAGAANVNANYELMVSLAQAAANAGFVALAVENDAGAVTGSRYVKRLYTTDTGRLAVGCDQTLFNEFFPGAALNTRLWQSPVTTMAIAVAGGFCSLNSGLSTASGAVAMLRTYRHFPSYMGFPTRVELDCQLTQAAVTNNLVEIGFFLATGVTAPTDGALFRITAAGELRCVLNANGTESISAALSVAALIGVNVTRHFAIEMLDSEVHFYIDGVVVAEMPLPAGAATPTMSMNLPVTVRTYNTAATAAAQVVKVTACNVTLADMVTQKPWAHVLCGGGGHGTQGQTGETMGTTANYANSANPTAAVPTNTTAALGTGLGGQFWETDTLAVTTDGIICSYQVPLGTAALPGTSLYITRITLASFVQTVLTGGPYVAQWSLAYGHTAVSLATADSATSKAPVRMSVGLQAVTAAQAVSTLVGTLIDLNLDSPIVVHPGEFVALVKKKVGTAPSAGVIAHNISFGSYRE